MSSAAVGLESRSTRATQGTGAFQFVLHSHLPYCRLAGRWPHGEEWIHEALAETYIPLLNVLTDLYERGIRGKMTLSLSPVLVEQLSDPDVCANFVLYVDEEIEMASRDLARFDHVEQPQLHYLASYYLSFYEEIKNSFVVRYQQDVISALKKLQDAGCIEISTCAATHGYLPLLSRDSSIYAQIRTAVASYTRHFGRPPRAIWLPECAYRPARLEADGTTRPGIEAFLAAQGIGCFFVETASVEKGRPGYRPRGAIGVGPYALAEKRFQAESSESDASTLRAELSTDPGGSTYQAYIVAEPDGSVTVPPVAVIGRNERTGMQVWSADWGYPGDADYREFHRKDAVSGLQYWRVTSPDADLGDKDTYHPDWAADKVSSHSLHFATLVEELLADYRATTGEYGLISSNYDTELFGHWWFEGVTWIGQVLEHLAESDSVDLTTTSEFLGTEGPRHALAIPEGSWGAGGTHWTWDNPDTHWMWAPIHEAERRMEGLVARYPEAAGDLRDVLNQAARELLLVQSSDWPFLVTTGQAREYAVGRFHSHLERFEGLAGRLESGALAEATVLAKEYYQRDNVFPDMDYRWLAERQGRVA
ncbi:MAG: 1,4-alpha-glucan branching protein domain-containing protein [Anaerolineae bacterium]